MDEAAKLKAAQAAEAELLKEVGRGEGLHFIISSVRRRRLPLRLQARCQQLLTTQQLRQYVLHGVTGGARLVSCSTALWPPLQANGVDAFEELKKMAIDGEGWGVVRQQPASGQAAPAMHAVR